MLSCSCIITIWFPFLDSDELLPIIDLVVTLIWFQYKVFESFTCRKLETGVLIVSLSVVACLYLFCCMSGRYKGLFYRAWQNKHVLAWSIMNQKYGLKYMSLKCMYSLWTWYFILCCVIHWSYVVYYLITCCARVTLKSSSTWWTQLWSML